MSTKAYHGCDMAAACRDIRKGHTFRREDGPDRYVACWSEKEVLDDAVCDAFVIIPRTKGCQWAQGSGCSFCGYISDTDPEVDGAHLEKQLASAMERYRGEPVVKVFTSGSFLDDDEVPKGFQAKAIDLFKEKGVKRLVIETLPSFATNEKVGWAVERFDGEGRDIEFALGLESATPDVLRYSVNKPAKVEDFLRASDLIRSLGGRTRFYIVIKPPLLSEKEALEDAVRSANAVKGQADTISFNPINVQRGTVVERLWRRGEYQPPWLWTVVEVLRRTADLGPRVMSGPSGAGTRRGAHNCGKCDKKVLKAIQRFSTERAPTTTLFDDVSCGCKELWKDQLEVEDHVHGPFTIDRR